MIMMNSQSVDIVWDPSTQMSSLDCWDYSAELDCIQGSQDLQLAAELGKTLLDRNKELETNLKTHQATIDEQSQEIEYMKKQTAALREVNDSRLKVYEQLEVSIQELERANHRLVVDNTAEKKKIKSQGVTIDSLEAKIEELQKQLDELKLGYDNFNRHQQDSDPPIVTQSSDEWKSWISQKISIQKNLVKSPSESSPISLKDGTIRVTKKASSSDEEVTELLRQLQDFRNQKAKDHNRISELREQLETISKANNSLEDQINDWRNKAHDMQNLQEEIHTLEEVKRGKLCARCLRDCETRNHDEISIMLDHEEDDDLSITDSSFNDSRREVSLVEQESTTANNLSPEIGANPYRILVEKYEALLEVQRHQGRCKPSIPLPSMSLQEELEMSGDFNGFRAQSSDDTDKRHECPEQKSSSFRSQDGRNGKKPFSTIPTDVSEAETVSSGFFDETSSKGTQTEGRPGSFLCSIADEDCKFSIYDDTSSFESRFNKAPEYRQLFREIFGVLKRAAVAKDEGEKLHLLDSSIKCADSKCQNIFVEHDDTMSVTSSVISSVVSEPVIRIQTATPKKGYEQRNSSRGESHGARHSSKRYPQYDYLSVQVKKKHSAVKNPQTKLNITDRSSTPEVGPNKNCKFSQTKSNSAGKRHKFRPLTQSEQDSTIWNGNTIHVFSSRARELASSRRINGHIRDQPHSPILEYNTEYKPSSASEEVARLRKLEMSYAEALRMPNKSKANHSRRH